MTSNFGWKTRIGFLASAVAMLSFTAGSTLAQNAPPPSGSGVEQQGPGGQDPRAGQSSMNQGQIDPGAMGQDGDTGQDVPMAQDDSQDPPSRVARISFLDGSVSMQPGGTGDWGAASLNRPVTIGDKIWTDQNSRLELQAGEASIHLGAMTALSFLNLDENAVQMRLAEGRLNFRIREMREGDLDEVDTPNVAFTVKKAGAFRVDVNENGDTTELTVIRGEGEVAAGGQIYTLHEGERATITGADVAAKYEVHAAPREPDEVDKWSQDRDLREENSASAKYVSREVVGYSDLDDYGSWNEEPNVGNVWYPNNVAGDWAPYSNGYWSFVGPWGWTWVDYAPWGFAPFHYGRWGFYGNRWGWCPGPIYARPYYGPAFVGFLGGFHGGFGFGVGIGVGWFPLGWGEPYRPWYHAGGRYWNNVNVHNTFIRNVNVINHGGNYRYAYSNNTRAVTAASHSAFVSGQGINRGAAHLNEASLRGAHVVGGVSGSPTRGSYFGAAGARARVATPSAAIQNRTVIARNTPAAGASHLPVRTMNGNVRGIVGGANNGSRGMAQQNGPNRGSFGGSSGAGTNRPSEIASNRPPSAMTHGNREGIASTNPGRAGNGSGRTWNAQGSTTDSGRGPQGFGGNRPSNQVRSAPGTPSNRPPWSRNPSSGTFNGNNASGSRGPVNTQSAPRNSGNRPPSGSYGNSNYGGTRGYSSGPSNGNRGSSGPRSYGAPAAPRSSGGSSAAPRGSSGGGSAPHGSSGGSHGGGGGGGPHGGGGGGPHGRH